MSDALTELDVVLDKLGSPKEIMLTKGMIALVSVEDYQHLSQFKWHAKFDGTNWYAARNSPWVDGKRKPIPMHRVILNAPDGLEVDHRDGNGLNNQRDNLRLATHAKNKCNARLQVNSTSGYKGVSWHKKTKKWQSRITSDGKLIYLGIFDTAIDAARAYDAAALRYHGEYARINSY